MKNNDALDSPVQSQMEGVRAELAGRIARLTGSEETRLTGVPGLYFTRRTAPTPACSGTYEPGLAVVVQGRKRVDLGARTFIFDQSRYLLTSVDLPIVGQVNRSKRGSALSVPDAEI